MHVEKESLSVWVHSTFSGDVFGNPLCHWIHHCGLLFTYKMLPPESQLNYLLSPCGPNTSVECGGWGWGTKLQGQTSPFSPRMVCLSYFPEPNGMSASATHRRKCTPFPFLPWLSFSTYPWEEDPEDGHTDTGYVGDSRWIYSTNIYFCPEGRNT